MQEILERAREVAVVLAERAPTADRERKLTQDSLRMLHEAGLLTLTIPRSLGGAEVDVLTQMEIYEIIGGACASTAWSVANPLGQCSRMQGMMGAAAEPYLRTVVEDGKIIAHSAIPTGTTVAAPGGYLANGRWPFVSGSHWAGWYLFSTMVPGPPPGWEKTDAAPEPPKSHNRWLVVHPSKERVRIDETWEAMALRASMSHDVLMEDVFVPEDRAPLDNRPPSHVPWVADAPPALRVPSRSPFWMASIMLGIAQAALDDTLESAKTSTMALGGQAKIRMPGNQFAVADAAMAIESGRAFLHQEVRLLLNKARSGEEFVPGDAVRMSMAGLVARENAQKAVDRLFAIRGATGLFEANNFERHYRDVRAGTLHAVSTPDVVRENTDKYLFGVPADTQPRWG